MMKFHNNFMVISRYRRSSSRSSNKNGKCESSLHRSMHWKWLQQSLHSKGV